VSRQQRHFQRSDGDVEAVRISGSAIVSVLLHDSHFLEDLERARAELRQVIGLRYNDA
jgi:hypothetical protein